MWERVEGNYKGVEKVMHSLAFIFKAIGKPCPATQVRERRCRPVKGCVWLNHQTLDFCCIGLYSA
jgi:hypothetical protein